MNLTTLLHRSLDELGLDLDPLVQAKMLEFQEKLLDTNKRMNLTSIKDPAQAVTKHLIDSLSALSLDALESSGRQENWLDLGSGGGLPGIPVALARPDIRMGLVEATKKKAAFLSQMGQDLKLGQGLKVYPQRAEDLGRGVLRGKASVILARGLNQLRVLLELAIPLLETGGVLVAYKGPKVDAEISSSVKAMSKLCSKVVDRRDFSLPFSDEPRSLLVIKKLSETPSMFPRSTGTPAKDPL